MFFFFSSRRRHTRYWRDWSSDVCSSDLREILPIKAIATTEVGQCQMWTSLHFDVISPGTFFSSTGLGTMGFGFPASIGAKAAMPDRSEERRVGKECRSRWSPYH